MREEAIASIRLRTIATEEEIDQLVAEAQRLRKSTTWKLSDILQFMQDLASEGKSVRQIIEIANHRLNPPNHSSQNGKT